MVQNSVRTAGSPFALPPKLLNLHHTLATSLDTTIYAEHYNHDQIVVLEPVILAVNRRVTLQRLQHVCLSPYRLEDAGWDSLLRALACAPHLTSLQLFRTNLSPASMSTFSALLSQNAFALLQSQNLSDKRSLGDKGVALLVEGLVAPACWTRLTLLDLYSVGMGDVGMGTFSALLSQNASALLQSLKQRDS